MMIMMMVITISARDQSRRGDGEYGRLYGGAEGHDSRDTHGHSLTLFADDDDGEYYIGERLKPKGSPRIWAFVRRSGRE